MNLEYKNDLLIEAVSRSTFRRVLSDAGMWLADDSPLERLYCGRDVPAVKVLPQLEELLSAARGGSRLFEYSGTDGPDPEQVEAFIVYAKKQIDVEAVQAKMRSLIKVAEKAGISYGGVQRMATRAMDDYLVKNPEAFQSADHGWGF